MVDVGTKHRRNGLRIGAVGVCVAASLGCGGRAISDAPIEGSRVIVVGDWDDVPAAVELGVGRGEAAVLSSDLGDERSAFEILTIDEEPGELTFRRLDGGIEIEAFVGLGVEGLPTVRRRNREAVLLRAVSTRLEELAGVDVAPTKLD